MRLHVFPLLVLATLFVAPARAQTSADYPAKPVRVIVGLAPGGATDIVARIFAQKLSENIGRSFVVENRPGGGSITAATLLTKAPADGYQVLAASGSYTIVPAVAPRSGFDPMKDLAPVSLVTEAPFILMTHPALPVRTLKELIALAKARPGQLDFGSSGHGTSTHLAAELLNTLAGIRLNNINYKGTGPALVETMGGQVHMLFGNVLSSLPYVKSGKLRALGVTTVKRSAALPEVPAIREVVAGYEVTAWHGWFVPNGTPAPIVARLTAELVKAVRSPEMQEKLAADGGEPVGSTPAELARYVAVDFERWRKVVKAAGIQLDKI